MISLRKPQSAHLYSSELPIWTDKIQENMAPVNAAVQGLIAAEHSLEKTAERIARAPSSSAADYSVSLSDEAVGLLSARDAYEMNLRVLQVGDNMTKKLVDYMA
jgi:flagellar basal body rod protein FlgC